MMSETRVEVAPADVDAAFHSIWRANGFDAIEQSVIIPAEAAIYHQAVKPEEYRTTYKVTEVTLRDGQQQETEPKVVPVQDRVTVFEEIVRTGVDRIEIGHLGNKKADQALAREIVATIAKREQDTDEDAELYRQVQIQVLFGSQKEPTQDGIRVLQEAFADAYGEDWQEKMSEKVVVHVYDRVDEELRKTASTYYTAETSAQRITEAAQFATDAGMTQFSVSGEAATDTSVGTAIQFHRSINDYLFAHGATNVNVNLANTFGASTDTEWNASTLAVFNNAVKAGYDGKVSTSIHTHNDGESVGFTTAALVAGFDRIDSTLFGMGERMGNVPVIDVHGDVLLAAHREVIREGRTESERHRQIGHVGLRRVVQVDPTIAARFGVHYEVAERVAAIFGTPAQDRFYHTRVAHPRAHDNGSGPHDQAMARSIIDPVHNRAWAGYESTLTRNHILGRPDAFGLAIADPEAVDAVTVGNHAGGGYTDKIKRGELTRSEVDIMMASENFRRHTETVVARAVGGVMLVAA